MFSVPAYFPFQVGLSLKQFLPQLQTTFLKSLVDPHRQVRLKAAFALSRLVLIHGKADPLFLELHTAIKTTEDSSIKYALVNKRYSAAIMKLKLTSWFYFAGKQFYILYA